MKNLFVVLDLETTGLDPRPYEQGHDEATPTEWYRGDNILEVGAILVGERDPRTGHEPDFHALVQRTKPMIEIDPFVVGMHTKNGLWEALRDRAIPANEADRALALWLVAHGATPGDGRGANASGNVVLVGYSVHFDHAFLKAQFPETARLLSHRVRDVGAFLSQCTEWGLPVPAKHPAMPHRALADAQIELTQYLSLRDCLQGLAADSTLFRGSPAGKAASWAVPHGWDANGTTVLVDEAHHEHEVSGVRPIPRYPPL